MTAITIDIEPKKRGNWRPRVIIKVDIKGKEFPHRPYLPEVVLFSTHFLSSESYPAVTWKRIASNLVTFDFSDMERDGDDAFGLYHSPKRRQYDGNLSQVSVPVIKDCVWVDECVSLSYSLDFWLPWRAGARPDYSDYAARFQEILRWMKDTLEHNDSGQNNGISLTLERREYLPGGLNVRRKLNIGGIDDEV